MGGTQDPDRERWPEYWRMIRTVAVWLVTIVVVVGFGAFLPRPDGVVPGIAVGALIGPAVVVVATTISRRVDAWWERTSA